MVQELNQAIKDLSNSPSPKILFQDHFGNFEMFHYDHMDSCR